MEVPADILHPGLYSALVAWRRSEATARNVPAYVVLQQKALLGISNLLPQDLPSLLRVPYFGKARCGKIRGAYPGNGQGIPQRWR